MVSLDCRNTCAPAPASRLVQPPCFVCRDVFPLPVAPNPPGPVSAIIGTTPSTFSLKPDGTFITGTGISSSGSAVATDGSLELFLAPLVAHVEGSEMSPPYAVELQEGQELAIVFGATLKSGFGVRITDYYDVVFNIISSEGAKQLKLVPGNTPSGYIWTDGEGYNIVDSNGDFHSVQNVTRPSFLGITDTGVLWQLVSYLKGTTQAELAIAIEVTVTHAN